MIRNFLFVLCLGLAYAQDLASKADEIAKKSDFSGSVLVARGGKILLEKGYGMANVELDVPNAPNTKFRLGSITKQFTATAILQLASQGKLKVEDPVSKYVDAPPAWRDITIHNLLTHTSGIPNYTNFPEYGKSQREVLSPEQLVARFKDRPLDFPPGTKYQYSNSGYVVLGFILEKISGEKYEEYLKKHIFEVLDMQDTGYDHDTMILKHRAAGYEKTKDGKLKNADYIDMTIPFSAGSLYSTVEDLYRWDRALNTDKVLGSAWRQKMFTPFLNDYAYGWIVKDGVISHGGGINGFSTAIARYPNQDGCIIALTNLPNRAVQAMGQGLAGQLFGK
ncbi:MAG: beta-lactamase family protein [Acidobacteriia bacterium]|nr:beta-lactamase family protein [Terriglobia bacterium]